LGQDVGAGQRDFLREGVYLLVAFLSVEIQAPEGGAYEQLNGPRPVGEQQAAAAEYA
jgi:hypothetical protein